MYFLPRQYTRPFLIYFASFFLQTHSVWGSHNHHLFFFFLDDYQIILFSINTFPEINSHIPICLLGNLKTYFSEPNLQCSLSHHQLHLLTPLFINATTASQVTQTHLWVSPPSGDSAFINAINYQDSITEDKVTERGFSSPIITNPKFTTLLRNKKGTPAIT